MKIMIGLVVLSLAAATGCGDSEKPLADTPAPRWEKVSDPERIGIAGKALPGLYRTPVDGGWLYYGCFNRDDAGGVMTFVP